MEGWMSECVGRRMEEVINDDGWMDECMND